MNKYYEIGINFTNGKFGTFYCIIAWHIENHCLCLCELCQVNKYIPIENIEYFTVISTDSGNKVSNCETTQEN